MILFVIIMLLAMSSIFTPRRYYGGYYGPMFSHRHYYRPMAHMFFRPMGRNPMFHGPRPMPHGPMHHGPMGRR